MLRLRAPLLIVEPAVTPIAGRRLGCLLLGVWALRERRCSSLRRWGDRVVCALLRRWRRVGRGRGWRVRLLSALLVVVWWLRLLLRRRVLLVLLVLLLLLLMGVIGVLALLRRRIARLLLLVGVRGAAPVKVVSGHV